MHAEPLVDVVYTWVDGSDTAWLEQKKNYLKLENPLYLTADGHGTSRFTDRDELKYSLRSIRKFAPWVHHVYIVTAGQTPKWLKKHPFITVVNHKEIFRNTNVLPTFNSQAIESNLHHIPKLKENYLYFNDDVFLGHLAKESDFFTETGRAIIPLYGEMPTGPVVKNDKSWHASNKNATRLLTELYGQKTWGRPAHTLIPFKKSIVYDIEDKIPAIFTLVSSHRFRSLLDYAMTNGLIPHLTIKKGQAIVVTPNYEFTECGDAPERDIKSLNTIAQKKPLSFCIQDNGKNPLSLRYINEFFEAYFPESAPWEETK